MTTFYPNKIEWRPGDIVIHKNDPKDKGWLRFVHGYNAKGMLVTEFVSGDRPKGYLFNDFSELYNPVVYHVER